VDSATPNNDAWWTSEDVERPAKCRLIFIAGNFGRGNRKLGHYGGTSRNVSKRYFRHLFHFTYLVRHISSFPF